MTNIMAPVPSKAVASATPNILQNDNGTYFASILQSIPVAPEMDP